MDRRTVKSGLVDKRIQALAALLAMAINALIFHYLMFATIPPQPRMQPGKETALRLRWLPRPTVRMDPMPQQDLDPGRSAPRQPSPKLALRRVMQQADHGPPTVTTTDEWSLPRAIAPQSDASTSMFSHDPLEQPTRPMTAHVDRMALKMQDRSIGGRLQQLTYRANCMELRKALQTSPGSAATVIATMQRYGCSI